MKSYIIYLPKIQASNDTAIELKTNLEKLGMEAELFEGTMGPDAVKKFDKEGRTLYPYGLKGKLEADGKEALKASSPGVKGCFDSHYRLWKKCVKLDSPIIIWEDDIVITREFKPVEWDDVLIVALGHPTKSLRWMDLLENPTGVPKAINYKSPSMPGCCGYAIKPNAARKLIETYSDTYRPADNAINRNVVNMEIHSHIMGIAKVKGKRSLTKAKAWKNYKL
jgi:GR25 family glycosyltransferase involved in LPS biosynthesis